MAQESKGGLLFQMKVNISKPDKDGSQEHNEVLVEPHDVWAFDLTLAPIIAQGLKLIRESDYRGTPISWVDKAEEYWREFDHMIWVFQTYSTYWEGEIYDKYSDAENLSKEEIESINAEIMEMYRKFQRGFEFFGKHYINLWA